MYPIATRRAIPIRTEFSGTTTSMSMIGLAASPGTDVLPTCSTVSATSPIADHTVRRSASYVSGQRAS